MMDEMPERSVVIVEQGGRGGVADYTEQLVGALAAEGVQVELVTASDHTFAPFPTSVRVLPWFTYFRGGTPWRDRIRRVRGHRAINGLRFLVMAMRLLPLARRAGVVHQQGHDVVALDLFLVSLLRLVGVRVVITPHNTFSRGGERRGLVTLLGLAHVLIVHTQWDLDQLPSRLRERAHVIPHGDYGPLAARGAAVPRAAARARFGLPPEVPVALCFGQLRADKGLDDVLRAAVEVPTLHVVLAGEDTGGLADVQALLHDPALAGRVLVRPGFQTIDDAAALFAAADVAVLAYRRASMSGVLLLAYGFGRPVAVYPVGGLPEAVEPGHTGWICARADVPALTETLREVAALGRLEGDRRGAAGRKLAATRFAWSVVAERTAALYRAPSRISR